MTDVHRIDLELGPKIGSGAQGQLFKVEAVRSPVAAELPRPLIFKEFHAGLTVSGAGLASLARFRAGLDDHDRDVIDTMTVWPCAVVEDGSARACGYLMRSIPEAFFQHIETSVGAEHIPREIQGLFVPEPIARKNFGETANAIERMALAREMAFILGFLHKRDFVYGDLSYKNAVYRLRPHPSVILLDCDAIRRIGETAGVPQLHSPGWKPPEGGPQTKGTDRYKLGLFVLRCLTPGVNAQNRDPDKAVGHLDAEGLSLLRRALGDPADARTTGKEWVEYFNQRISTAGGVRRRTGQPIEPTRMSVRRAPARPLATIGGSSPMVLAPAVGASSHGRAYVLTPGGGVQLAPARRGGSSAAALLQYAAPAKTRSWSPLTLGARSFSSPNPPVLSRGVGYVAAFGFVAAALVGILAVGFVNSGTKLANNTTTTVARGAPVAVPTTTPPGSPGVVTTPLARSAIAAVTGAGKHLNAIDQRAVGLVMPTGSYQADTSALPWVVQFAPADPDRSSGTAHWRIRNVAVDPTGAFSELSGTTITAEQLPDLPGGWAVGLDAIRRDIGSGPFTGIVFACDPSGAEPDCVWKVGRDGVTQVYSAAGTALAEPPDWAR